MTDSKHGSPPSGLTRRYERDGYVVLPGALDGERVARARRALDEVFAERRPRRFLLPSEVIDDPRLGRELGTVPFEPAVRSLLATLLGHDFVTMPDLCVQREMYGRWHRDCDSEGWRAGLLRASYRNLKVGVFLQDNDPDDGGGIDVLPGAHRHLLRGPSRRLSFALKHARDAVARATRRRRLAIRAGDVVAFDSQLPHLSTPRRGIGRAPTKYVLYLNACRAGSAAEVLAHARRRAMTEEPTDRRGERFWSDHLSRVFPDDYPPCFVEAAERAGATVASLSRREAACFSR